MTNKKSANKKNKVVPTTSQKSDSTPNSRSKTNSKPGSKLFRERKPQASLLQAFKKAPRRFQPRGLFIIHEDHDIIVVDKSSGLLTVSTEKEKDNTAYNLLTNYVQKGNSKSRNRIFIVHRLDKNTSGVIVFAKTDQAKCFLQDNWQDFKKTYYGIIYGKPPAQEGIISTYLAEDKIHKMHSVKDKGKGKLSETKYKVLKTRGDYHLLEIGLITGRKNQIRVHMSENGCPIAGDKKYSKSRDKARRLMLHAAVITLKHPHTKEEITFKAKIPSSFDTLVKR
jgi:RluA family pseudouridine synthase